MLNRYQIRKVQKLIDAGVPIRRIARKTKIARGTIQSIVRGKHPSFRRPVLGDVETTQRTGEIGFCERCRVAVELPCLACVARNYLSNHSVNEIAETFEPLGMELNRDDYSRYIKIRKRKEREEQERENENETTNLKIRRIDATFREAA